jgi:Ca2+-binding EF-hand superfamily protein
MQRKAVGGDLAQAVRDAFFGQFETVKQAFHKADVNGGGSISHDEFASCVRSSGLQISDADVESTARAIDTNGDGTINYNEFLRFLTDATGPDDYATNAVGSMRACLRLGL